MKKSKIITIVVCLLSASLIVLASILYGKFELGKIAEIGVEKSFITNTVLFVIAIGISVGIFFATILIYLEKKRKQEKYLAYWNSELGIYNENFFIQIVNKRRLKHIHSSAVICFNIMNHKAISAQFGYDIAEMILNSVGTILREQFSEQDYVYAYTLNSSFVLYMHFENNAECAQKAKDILDAVNSRVFEKGINFNIKMAFGICFVDNKDMTAEECLKRANVARLSIHDENSDFIAYFDNSMLSTNMSEMELTKEIARALENEEFEVYYQPKFDIQLNRFIGAEALIRWNHPTKGIVSPGSFIPFAERNGQIVPIGRYVFTHVCQDIASWKKTGQRLLMISVNISRMELYQSDLIKFFEKTIQEYKINPLLIEIELTESVAVRDLIFATSIMKKIRALRFKVAMDDFGTGYSSLSSLKNIPIDTLKLDKSFFDDIEIDAKSRDIVRLIVELAKALNLYIVAEGLQTAKQIQFIKTTKCDSVQGHFYSAALTKSEYENLLRKNKFE